MTCLDRKTPHHPTHHPSQVLGILASVLQRDVDERGGAFNGRPYYRMCAACGAVFGGLVQLQQCSVDRPHCNDL